VHPISFKGISSILGLDTDKSRAISQMLLPNYPAVAVIVAYIPAAYTVCSDLHSH